MAAESTTCHFPEFPESVASKDPLAQPSPAIRILCVDDHPTIRAGLATIIRHQTDMQIVGAASTGCDGIRRFRELLPDVTLMDLRLPDLSGVEALISIRSEFPQARVIMLTTFDRDVDVVRSLQAGAAGYLLKSTPTKELLAAIRNVHRGRKSVSDGIATNVAEHLGYEPLSRRELEVLDHLAGGNRNRDIAQKMFISEETVKAHVRHIMDKLGANGRTHALAIAIRRGLIRI